MVDAQFSLTERFLIGPTLALVDPRIPAQTGYQRFKANLEARVWSIFISVVATADTAIHLVVGTYKGLSLVLRNICRVSPPTWGSVEVHLHFKKVALFTMLTVIGSLVGIILPNIFIHLGFSPCIRNLRFEDYHGPITLPEGLKVNGLFFGNCPGPITLPEGLSVDGNLHFKECKGPITLPEGLSVDGNLHFKECKGPITLPEGLSVDGNLHFKECKGPITLPEGLSVDGNLHFKECEGPITLPEKLKVKDLFFEDCPGPITLPEGLSVDDKLHFNNCQGPITLLRALGERGELYFERCPGPIILPEKLIIRGGLHFSSCPGPIILPEELSVSGSLVFSYCQDSITLQEGLNVGWGWGGIIFENCSGSITLRERCVTGGLFFHTHQGLITLPGELSVTGPLSFRNCQGPIILLEGLSVDGNLTFENCPGLTSLPPWITQMGERADGGTRIVTLENTGLSEDVLNRLRAHIDTVGAPGMQFNFSMPARAVERNFLTPEEAVAFWKNEAGETNATSIPALGVYRDSFKTFLARLVNTAEYGNKGARQGLATRVMQMIQEMAGSEEINRDALQRMHHGLTTCDDRIIHAFEEICMQIKVAELMGDDIPEKELRRRGKGFYYFERVQDCIRRRVEQLRWVDRISIELAFIIPLAESLELPIDTRHMIFRNAANTSDKVILEARDRIMGEYTEEALTAFMQQWGPWIRYQRRIQCPPFEGLEEISEPVKEPIECAIFGETVNLVSIGGTFVGYEALRKHYLNTGKNPFTQQPLEWADVRRVR
ncbi:MAG: hypothetical protein LVR00_07535 [Rhabdochlamydiaceae bacterium]|jgi:hypothetical protein